MLFHGWKAEIELGDQRKERNPRVIWRECDMNTEGGPEADAKGLYEEVRYDEDTDPPRWTLN